MADRPNLAYQKSHRCDAAHVQVSIYVPPIFARQPKSCGGSARLLEGCVYGFLRRRAFRHNTIQGLFRALRLNKSDCFKRAGSERFDLHVEVAGWVRLLHCFTSSVIERQQMLRKSFLLYKLEERSA
ncbi:hypothetical protein I5T99_12590 [Stenotrophomonas maltophilia]|nr:hypothetical protein [Stenotrophomonas maltophilia]